MYNTGSAAEVRYQLRVAGMIGAAESLGGAMYSMLHNGASGPEIGLPGRILAGLLPGKSKSATWAAEGRP